MCNSAHASTSRCCSDCFRRRVATVNVFSTVGLKSSTRKAHDEKSARRGYQRQRTCNEFDRFNRIDSHCTLIVCVKMGDVMWRTNLHKHPNYYPEEAAEFWHVLFRTLVPLLRLSYRRYFLHI